MIKKNMYKLNFIDSYRFMSTSLSDLADNLSEINKRECKSCIDKKKLHQNVILSNLKIKDYVINVKTAEKDALSQ